jgi:antitoxin MazE
MRTTIGKWGNSLGVRIPVGLAADARLEDGAEVEITLRDSALVIVPAESES